MSLLTAVQSALKNCEKIGADEAEAYAQRTRTLEVVLERGGIQSERAKVHQGMGVLCIKQKKLGFAFTSDLSKDSVHTICKNAVKLAKTSIPNSDWVSLPTAASFPGSPVGIFDPKVATLRSNEVLDLAMRAYDAVHECDKRAVIDDGKFSSHVIEVAVSNSHGIKAWEKETLLSGSITCVARERGRTSSMAFEYGITRDINFSPENIGRSAAEKSIASIRPKRAESFTGKVILDPDPASQILFYPIFYSVNADNVQRKRSIWTDKTGEKVAVDNLTLTDDGLLPRGIGSSSFDAEGVPHQETPIITKGILKSFLHNSFTANKEKKRSTGNASRDSYRTLPRVFVSNFIVEPGKKKLDDVISEVDKGIIVRRFSGNVHPESGDFSGVAKQASFIENGEVKHALKETMISGNTFETLMNIVDIGSEIRPTFGRIYTPPILIDKVTIVSK